MDRGRSTQVANLHGKFKLKYPSAKDRPLDVFSQSDPSLDNGDDDDYLEDSFCVPESCRLPILVVNSGIITINEDSHDDDFVGGNDNIN